jgi:hypothetical protein
VVKWKLPTGFPSTDKMIAAILMAIVMRVLLVGTGWGRIASFIGVGLIWAFWPEEGRDSKPPDDFV